MTATLETLRNVTTGTITTMLLKKGIRRSWMAGAMPFGFSGKRVVGPAFTLRFVPVREDLATPESWSKPISTRGAIEAMPENCVVVADAMGVTGAGIFGDILCMRMVKRGVTALITDGVMRDKHGVVATGLPVWCAGVAAPASVNQLTFVGWNEPIGCGGCAIFPDDIIVADDDGAVVIPAALVDFVANEGAEHELMESWLVQEVEKGAKLPGLYPPNEENKKRYEEWKKKLLARDPAFKARHKSVIFSSVQGNLLSPSSRLRTRAPSRIPRCHLQGGSAHGDGTHSTSALSKRLAEMATPRLQLNWGERIVTAVAASLAVLIVATIAVLMGMT